MCVMHHLCLMPRDVPKQEFTRKTVYVPESAWMQMRRKLLPKSISQWLREKMKEFLQEAPTK